MDDEIYGMECEINIDSDKSYKIIPSSRCFSTEQVKDNLIFQVKLVIKDIFG